MGSTTLSRRRVLAAAGGLVAASSVSRAQGFPSRPIRFIVGFAPGGGNDAIARLVAPYMAEKLGQPVTVENKTGATGNLATEFVAKSAPDGHTILVSSGSQIVAAPHAYTDLAVNPVKDLAHIGMVSDGAFVMVINPSLPATTVGEFVALSKREPGRMTFGSPGIGATNHLAGELFKLRTGADIKPVHYRGSGALFPDLLSNQVQMTVGSVSLVESYVKSNRLRALMVMAKDRAPQLPDIPSSVELGVRDMEKITFWIGLHVPRATPDPILRKLNATLAEVLKIDVLRERMLATGLAPMGDSPEAFGARIASDYELYGEICRAANVRVQK